LVNYNKKVNQLIPTSLFGINSELCNEFFNILPELLEKSEIEDPEYEKMLYDTLELEGFEQIENINEYINFKSEKWGEEINQEILSTLEITKYPDVSMLQNLLSLKNIDCVILSYWLHFLKNIHPIYDEKACEALKIMNLNVPFDSNDLTCYSKYVSVIEGLKQYAPAEALPEYALPRQRLLQLGLVEWLKQIN
tara:strand:+ start:270 stop:851 length:582 start_codon:yes stop_codon:yes gene_type:complete